VISSSRFKHLISLLERYDLTQMAHLPLHAVDALNDDKNLLPGPPGFRLPICYAVPEQPLQVCNIIVHKHLGMPPAAVST